MGKLFFFLVFIWILVFSIYPIKRWVDRRSLDTAEKDRKYVKKATRRWNKLKD